MIAISKTRALKHLNISRPRLVVRYGRYVPSLTRKIIWKGRSMTIDMGNKKNEANDPDHYFEWVAYVFTSPEFSSEEKCAESILQQCSNFHYKQLNMDEITQKYKGRIDEFLAFITTQWGWIIYYDKEKQEIIADENKEFCVCPVVKNAVLTPSMCQCSEYFIKRMFSTVSERDVEVTVTHSVLRGDRTCVYKINLSYSISS